MALADKVVGRSFIPSRTLVRGLRRELGVIDTLFLNRLLHFQETRRLDDGKHEGGEDSSPDEDNDPTDHIRHDLFPDCVPVCQLFTANAEVVDVKQRNRHHAPNPTSSVNRKSLHRIVDLQLLQQLRRPTIHRAADQADQDGRARMNAAAARGDGHKPMLGLTQLSNYYSI